MKYFQIVIISFLVLVNFSTAALSQDVTLQWDPSPSPNIVGYRVHYSMKLPLGGPDTNEIDVENSLIAQVTGLTDGAIYYFSVTAYDNQDNESGYSNIVSTDWIPALLAPADNRTQLARPVTFRWDTPPYGYDVRYTLHYGTDRDQVENAAIPPHAGSPGEFGSRLSASVLTISMLLFLLTGALLHAGKKNLYRPARLITAVALTSLVLAACDGGGSSDFTYDRSVIEPDQNQPVYVILNKGTADYHQAFDLEPATTYYWKIAAVDNTDPDRIYTSPVFSFTTE